MFTNALLRADVIYTVSIDDPNNLFAGYDGLLQSTVTQAGNDWSRYLPGVSGTTTTINVKIVADTSLPRSGGASTSVSLVNTLPEGTRVYEQGLGELYRTGRPSGSAPDAIIPLNPLYLKNELSFASVTPSDRTDALSVFRHELGHAIAINGYRNLTTGSLPSDAFGPYESTFDRWVVFGTDGIPDFIGPAAEAEYGLLYNAGVPAPVPLTMLGGSQAIYHVGNGILDSSTCPTTGLVADLMNGVVFCRGEQYGISKLDLAILEDTGLRVDFNGNANVPEPSVCITILLGLAAVALSRWRFGRAQSVK